MEKNKYLYLRREMVRTQIKARGITDRKVLEAFLSLPRELFVPEPLQAEAYEDRPLPIGYGQTISQPYITALMTEQLEVFEGHKILEIGTGSGYQAAVLCFMGARVYSVERIRPLAERAEKTITGLDLDAKIRVSDGTTGWEEASPFDRILVTAAAPQIPEHFLGQLAPEGRMIIPVGDRFEQTLVQVDKADDGSCSRISLGGCVFVPLIGEYGWDEES